MKRKEREKKSVILFNTSPSWFKTFWSVFRVTFMAFRFINLPNWYCVVSTTFCSIFNFTFVAFRFINLPDWYCVVNNVQMTAYSLDYFLNTDINHLAEPSKSMWVVDSLKIADLQAHNALQCNVLWASRSAWRGDLV